MIFKLMKNAVFEGKYGKCKKSKRYQPCSNRRKKELFSVQTKLSYNTIFFKKFMSNRNEKNKPVYLALSILEMSKTVMYGFWCDYVKPKYKEQAKLCYMGTHRFIVYIKTRNDIDIVKDVETRFDTLRYELMKIKKQKAQEVCQPET